MGRFDEFVNFLFRTLKGRLVLIGCTVFIACMCSGCFMFDCPACVCEKAGCDACASCLNDCDDQCNDCGLDACDNSCATCLFGDGCEKDCGSCGYVVCGGCNRTCATECGAGGSCGTCGTCGTCHFGNCSVYEEDPKLDEQTLYIYVSYVAYDSEGNFISDRFDPQQYSIKYGELAEYREIPFWNSQPLSYYFVFDSAYDIFDGQLVDQVAGSDGVLFDGRSYEEGNLTTLTVKLVEKAAVGENYRVSFDLSKYTTNRISDVNLQVGSVISGFPDVKDVPTVNGYEFKYWTDQAGNRVTISNGAVFRPYVYAIRSNSVVLTAVYEPITYSVTVYIGDSTVSVTLAYGETLDKALDGINTDRDGMRFDGWALTFAQFESGTVAIVPANVDDYKISGDTTLYAVYSNSVALTLHFTEGPDPDVTSEHKLYEGDTFDLPTVESKQGPYLFDGWYTSPDFDDTSRVYSSVYVNSTTRNVYAKWTLVESYEITYFIRREGGTSHVQHRVVPYTFDNANPIALEQLAVSLVPSGYDFIGWRRDQPDGDGAVMTELPAGTFGDLRLYAVYTPKKYTARLYPDGGTIEGYVITEGGYYESFVEYGARNSLPVPTREGHVFTGWFELGTDNRFTAASGLMVAEYDKTAAVRLEARWELEKYTVTFTVDNRNVAVYDVTHGELVPSVPADPVPIAGYVFDGWYDGALKFDAQAPVYANHAYAARFVLAEYTITLTLTDGAQFADGATQKTVTVHYGDRNIELGEPLRTGYDFDGWKIAGTSDSDMLTDFEGVLSLYGYTEDIELVAVWTARH